ncbi:MAG: hypothetical protein ACE5OS_02800 [Anaerolineae bacterium]
MVEYHAGGRVEEVWVACRLARQAAVILQTRLGAAIQRLNIPTPAARADYSRCLTHLLEEVTQAAGSSKVWMLSGHPLGGCPSSPSSAA